MNSNSATIQGESRTIRYLVNSVDDLREVTDTVMFLVRSHCEAGGFAGLLESIPLSAIPMPQSLSSFILGFIMPQKLLANATGTQPQVSHGFHEVGAEDDSSNPDIRLMDGWSQVSFELTTLSDLRSAVRKILLLLQSNSERLEFVNLKRRTRLKVAPLGTASRGLRLDVRAPGTLEWRQNLPV